MKIKGKCEKEEKVVGQKNSKLNLSLQRAYYKRNLDFAGQENQAGEAVFWSDRFILQCVVSLGPVLA